MQVTHLLLVLSLGKGSWSIWSHVPVGSWLHVAFGPLMQDTGEGDREDTDGGWRAGAWLPPQATWRFAWLTALGMGCREVAAALADGSQLYSLGRSFSLPRV